MDAPGKHFLTFTIKQDREEQARRSNTILVTQSGQFWREDCIYISLTSRFGYHMAISTGSTATAGVSKPIRLQTDFRNKRTIRPKVSVIIPTLNEAKNLPHVLPKVPLWVEEIIIVDGFSKDGTPEVAKSLHAKVRVVQEDKKGKGNALRRGFSEARGDIIVMLDADGSTLPSEIGRFVRSLRDGADFVKGSRFLQGAGTSDMGWLRRAGNGGLTWLVKMLFGGNYSDLCYGYNAFWRDVLPLLELDATGFEIETMMNVRALQAGLRVVEVHSFESERIHGESNLRTFPDGWRVLKTIMRERLSTRKPLLPKAHHAEAEIEL